MELLEIMKQKSDALEKAGLSNVTLYFDGSGHLGELGTTLCFDSIDGAIDLLNEYKDNNPEPTEYIGIFKSFKEDIDDAFDTLMEELRGN
jgi:hypothetical protein